MAKKAAPKKPNAWAGVPFLPEVTNEMVTSGLQPTQAGLNAAAAQAAPVNPEIALRATSLVVPGGLKANEGQAKIEEQNALKNLAVENTYLSPEDYNKLVLAAEQTEPVQRRKQELTDLDAFNRATIDALPAQTDLSPLVALVDQWSGSNFSKSYRKPSTAEDRAKLLMDYGAKTEANKQKLLDEVLKAAQYMKSGTATNQLTSMLMGQQGIGTEAFDPRPRSSGGGRSGAIDDWKVIKEGHAVNKEFQESKSRLDQLNSAFDTGDIGAIGRALSIAARELSGEKGVLTEQDVGRILPKTIGMTVDQFTAYLTSNPQVLVDPKIISGLKEETKRAYSRLSLRQQAKLKTLQDSMAQSGSFSGKTKLLDPVISNIGQSGQAPKGEETLGEVFRKRVKQRMEAEAKGKK